MSLDLATSEKRRVDALRAVSRSVTAMDGGQAAAWMALGADGFPRGADVPRQLKQGSIVEVAPLMRNPIGHAYAMHWLADNGEPAAFALTEASWKSKKNLPDNLVEVNWQLPAAGVDIGEKPDFGFTTDEERKRHGQLLGELKNFMNMVKGYGDPMMYPIYRNLSSFSHTTDLTAGVYLQQAADGRLIVHQEAHTDRLADLCWMPIPLLQAASVISPMIKGDPMKKLVTEACRDLGLPENLLPRRP